MEYNFDIVNRAGVKHQAADALSRLLTKGTDNSDIYEEIPIMAVATPALKRLSNVQDSTPEQTFSETNEPQLPALDELRSAQGADAYCENIRQTVRIPRSSLNSDKNGLLVRHKSTDGSLQKVVTQSIRLITLHSTHYSILAGDSGERRKYDTSRRKYFWPNISTNVDNTV